MPVKTPISHVIHAFVRAGFDIRPWELDEAIAIATKSPVQTNNRLFFRGTMRGLLQIQDDELLVVALNNERPGNGQFAATIRRMEKTCDALNLNIRIVQFWNLRLQAWFARRGYRIGESPEHGAFALRDAE